VQLRKVDCILRYLTAFATLASYSSAEKRPSFFRLTFRHHGLDDVLTGAVLALV
jgi:hypothetical protein